MCYPMPDLGIVKQFRADLVLPDQRENHKYICNGWGTTSLCTKLNWVLRAPRNERPLGERSSRVVDGAVYLVAALGRKAALRRLNRSWYRTRGPRAVADRSGSRDGIAAIGAGEGPR
ncbi:hypothetical protein NDU88_005978 [Pleurodeles waltl]|uniref:Uncharacterized protein n=1 Tax=Pleurodeles waltl TaxID=8319 RepID=A0AAV7WDD7_PLEWA|nr:hypothetical protein NDU88_005978 [Pleurodeles waltl]